MSTISLLYGCSITGCTPGLMFASPFLHRPSKVCAKSTGFFLYQLFLYGLFASKDPEFKGKTLVNSIYATTRLFSEPLEDRPQSPEFLRLTSERLKKMLDEIVDVSKPFRRTTEQDTCEYCDFKNICGR